MNVFHERLTGTDESFYPKRYRPFVYMGPGVSFDTATTPDGRRVHIRLSPTTNQIDGWPDYTGEADPQTPPAGTLDRREPRPPTRFLPQHPLREPDHAVRRLRYHPAPRLRQYLL